MENENLLRDYNKLMVRMKKAEEFLESNAAMEKKLKWIGEERDKEFNKLVRELSALMIRYEKLTGQAMKSEDILNGFN